MTDLSKKIADARRLDAEASKAPWKPAVWIQHVQHTLIEKAADGPSTDESVGDLVAESVFQYVPPKDRQNEANAAWMIHARNHHAALWDLVEAVRWLREGMRWSNEADSFAASCEDVDKVDAALARLEQVKP